MKDKGNNPVLNDTPIYPTLPLSEFSALLMNISEYLKDGVPQVEERIKYFNVFLQKIGVTSFLEIKEEHHQALQDFKNILKFLQEKSLIDTTSLAVLTKYPFCIRNIHRSLEELQDDVDIIPLFFKQLLKQSLDNESIHNLLYLFKWMKASNTLSIRHIDTIFSSNNSSFSAIYNMMYYMASVKFIKPSNQFVIERFLRPRLNLVEGYKLTKYLFENALLTHEALVSLSQITLSGNTIFAIWNGISGLIEAQQLRANSVQALFEFVLSLQHLRDTNNQEILMKTAGDILLILGQEGVLDIDFLNIIRISPKSSVKLLECFGSSGLLVLHNKAQLKKNLTFSDTVYSIYLSLESIQIRAKELNRFLFSRHTSWIDNLEQIISFLKNRGLWANNLNKPIRILLSRKKISMNLSMLRLLEEYPGSEIISNIEINQRIISLDVKPLQNIKEFLEFLRTTSYYLTQRDWLNLLNHPIAARWLLTISHQLGYPCLNSDELIQKSDTTVSKEEKISQPHPNTIEMILSLFFSNMEENHILIALAQLRKRNQLNVETLSALFLSLRTLEREAPNIQAKLPNIEAYSACKKVVFYHPEYAFQFVTALCQLRLCSHAEFLSYRRDIIQYPAFSQNMVEAYCSLRTPNQVGWELIAQYPMCAKQLARLINQEKINQDVLSLLNQPRVKDYIPDIIEALVQLPTTLWLSTVESKPPIIKAILASIEKCPKNTKIIAEAAKTLFKNQQLNSDNWKKCRIKRATMDEVLGKFSKQRNPSQDHPTKTNSLDYPNPDPSIMDDIFGKEGTPYYAEPEEGISKPIGDKPLPATPSIPLKRGFFRQSVQATTIMPAVRGVIYPNS